MLPSSSSPRRWLLCLAPAVVTLLWGERALRQSADKQLVMILGGTGFRMAFVLLAGWRFTSTFPTISNPVS